MNEERKVPPVERSATKPDLEGARRFHGHLGPWLVLGLKIGYAAVADLAARRHFGIEVTAWCPPAPPPSCLVDGLQWSTGATYGKRNITLEPSSEFRVAVRNKETGEGLLAVLAPETPALLRAWFDEMGEEASSRRVWDTPNDHLFAFSPLVGVAPAA